MADNENVNNNQPTESFGIDESTSSKNLVNFEAGFNKAELVEVKAHEIGKGVEKYTVLDFKFKTSDGIRTFTHREFIPKGKAKPGKATLQEDYDKKKQMLNSRIKHIWEAYAPFIPLGQGAAGWADFFNKVANQFNTGKEGKPIYQISEGGVVRSIAVWIKITYDDKGQTQFPQVPNFIEPITSANVAKPTTLEINSQYDRTIKPPRIETNNNANVLGGIVGGQSNTSPGGNDMGF